MQSAHGIPVTELLAAAERRDVLEAVGALYAELEAEIASQGPTCWNRGHCCRFGQYGHRLYVTGLEVAYYLAMRSGPPAHPCHLAPESDACPHAVGGICRVREARPLGCRIFYCDPAAQQWQGPLTERYLTRLRALHEALSVPYVYADWMHLLEALQQRASFHAKPF